MIVKLSPTLAFFKPGINSRLKELCNDSGF